MRLKVPASNPTREWPVMLKKYLTKFTVDILPSVAATVIGAYIVNHYIVTKPGADAPAAARMSAVNPKAAPEAAKAEVPSADVGNIPEAGVKAKGISEKAILEKSAAEKSQEKSQDKSSEKSAEKPADKPAETASIPADTRRHQPAPREKTAKAVPAPVPPAASAVVPVVAAAPNPAPPAETATAPEERRDANDLARAAIERLRGANDGSSRPQEAARVPDAARTPDAPRVVSAPAIRPLPPPIMVSTPERETVDSTTGSLEPRPPYAAAARNDDPRRPTPPADIPSPPLDLRAEAAVPSERGHTTVADDVLSAAKSVFHAVLPK
jgi:hypothetical protein